MLSCSIRARREGKDVTHSWPKKLRTFALLVLASLRFANPAALTAAPALPLYPAVEQYVVEPAFPGLSPSWATTAVFAPGDTNRLFLLGKTGRLFIVTNLSQPKLDLFLDLSAKTYSGYESGLLGLAFHPGWRTNRQFFVYYSTLLNVEGQSVLHQRVARFSIDPDNPNRALPDSEQPLLSQRDPNHDHNAGDLEFGPDGYLYIALGDGGGAFDTYRTSQYIHNDFFSGILRIDPDRRPENLEPNPHPAIHPGTYRVPADNPLLGLTTYFQQVIQPAKLRSEFFAIGFRNPYRIAFDPKTGELFANDVGQNRREEINHVVPGGNYGWLFYEGTIPWPYGLIDEPYAFPIYEYEHEEGRVAITGGAWYHGDRYPDLKGTYVFADFGGPIGSLTWNPQAPAAVRWIARFPGITDVQVNPGTDEILFSSANEGVVAKLVRKQRAGPPIPERLSETGLFADLRTLQPAPGIEPYDINVPFWSDHATKQRWFYVPPSDPRFGFFDTQPWITPEGALWVKHFELETNVGNPASRRKIETRVLVRAGASGELWGASYRWNDSQTDAELVSAAGRDDLIEVAEGEVIRTQKWRFPSREECLSCHNDNAGGLLGFNTAQLNRDALRDGQTTNQLAWMAARGFFHNPPESLNRLPALAAADDDRWSLDYRVHSYLAVNCAYCHAPGGPTRATWDGRLTTPLNQAGLVGQLALNNLEDIYGREPTYLVAPGQPRTSSVYRRVSEIAPYHMPPLATATLNASAIQLLGQWITNSLPGRAFTYSAWTNALAKDLPSLNLHPNADPDGDGLPNELEFLLGESPANGIATWRPALVGSPGDWKIRFIRKANLRFEVQVSAGLERPWVPLESPENRWFIGVADEPVEVSLPEAAQTQFYRVAVLAP